MRKSAKHREQECSVILADLKLLWETQKGICPYTGWNLVLLPCTTHYENTPLTTNRASVDRIDSSKGYTVNNIQFVAVIANFAKNAFTEEELINFCHDVYKYRNQRIYFNIWLRYESPYSSSLSPVPSPHAPNPHDLGAPSSPIPFSINHRRDEHSPFRQHLKLARRRMKTHGRECTITLEYLKELWERQSGRCPYTGWELDNPETTAHWDVYELHPKRASLDRIDSSVGYVPGNVQFVSVIANFGKRDFPEEKLLEFCQAVVDFRLMG
ncbi:MAG: hypothetical protein DSM106950_16500 [Stigonema ocellatum SAG 48.90 = DSM 106950]|nr:hypothetical protein [Stigonema ocellatum SAG 48.90 = DSM 106950]